MCIYFNLQLTVITVRYFHIFSCWWECSLAEFLRRGVWKRVSKFTWSVMLFTVSNYWKYPEGTTEILLSQLWHIQFKESPVKMVFIDKLLTEKKRDTKYNMKYDCIFVFLNYVTAAAVVQSPSHVQVFMTPWTAAFQDFLSFNISLSLLKLMSIESVMPSRHLILYCPPLPSVFPSIRVFSNESALCIRWPKYWSFSISPSSEFSGLISLKIN